MARRVRHRAAVGSAAPMPLLPPARGFRGSVCAALSAVALCACGGGSTTSLSVQTVVVTPPPTPVAVATPFATAPPTPAVAPGGPDLIAPTAARALLDRWNAARSAAFAANDAGPLAGVEAGPALDTDTTLFAQRRAGAVPRTGAPAVDLQRVVVPHQTAYPAIVYATQRTVTGSASVDEILAFTAAGAGAPWTLNWRASTPDAQTGSPPVQVGADGYGALLGVPEQRSLLTDAGGTATRLAADLRPGAPADAGMALVHGLPDITATARATVASFQQAGASAGVQFGGAPTPVAIQTTDGGAVIMVVVTYTATLAPAAGLRLTETSAHQYGQGLLAAGDYLRVVDTYTFVYAAQVPARTGGASITVFAVGGGLRSSTGTPAPAA